MKKHIKNKKLVVLIVVIALIILWINIVSPWIKEMEINYEIKELCDSKVTYNEGVYRMPLWRIEGNDYYYEYALGRTTFLISDLLSELPTYQIEFPTREEVVKKCINMFSDEKIWEAYYIKNKEICLIVDSYYCK